MAKMKYLSSKIPLNIAEYIHNKLDNDYQFIKMDEADNLVCPCYYEVFDYLFEKGYVVYVGRNYDFVSESFTEYFDWSIDGHNMMDSEGGDGDTWHDAANKAIENCIDIILRIKGE